MSERKLKIIKDFLGYYYRSNDEHLFYCPKCKHHKPKLSVNFDKNVYKCWVCDYNGRNLTHLVNRYGSAKNKQEWRKIAGAIDMSSLKEEEDDDKIVQIKLPEEFMTLTKSKPSLLCRDAINYLRNRGIERDDIVRWKMGYCTEGEYKNRVIVPSFDNDGEINYFIARSYDDNWMKYKNPSVEKDFIFNELFLDWGKDITIVEGIFDAVKATNAIPLLGSTLRENSYIFQKIVEKCEKIYIALDADAKRKEDKIIKLFMSYGVDVYRVNTDGYEDVGEMNKLIFQEKKEESSLVSMDNFLLDLF